MMTTTNQIALLIAENPVLALTDKEKFAEFMKDIKAEIDAFKPDITTPKGRAEISSLAYKVTRSKTAIDKAGKELNAVKRKEIDAVDAERRAIWDRLEALADEVRKPLTEWETAETLRQEKIAEVLDAIAGISIDPKSSAHIQEKIDFLNGIEIDPEVFQDRLSEGVIAKNDELARLETALAAAQQYEADQIELAELRAQKERAEIAERERLEKEAAEKESLAAAERAKIQAEKDAARAKAELEAREIARQKEIEQAAEKARQEEIQKAIAAQKKKDAEAATWRAEQEEKIAKIEAEKREIVAAQKRDQDARDAVAAAEKKAQDARDKDRKHRGEVMKAAKEAMIELGASEDVAKKIVLAIVASEIPNVRLVF